LLIAIPRTAGCLASLEVMKTRIVLRHCQIIPLGKGQKHP
jgi:hypothetical protein